MAGYKFEKKYKYLIDKPPRYENPFSNEKIIVGLNTGCSNRWPTRLWPEHKWVSLANELQKNGYNVLLLGGREEDEKNKRIAEKSLAKYLGHHSLQAFISIADLCDLVVTCATMALHVAIGLNKKVVLFNNIFNRNEFELYGKGAIVEPDLPCLGCYKREFDEYCPVPNCMEEISVKSVFDSIEKLVYEQKVQSIK